ncbi:hypothetical protein J2X32_000977 [Rheinheimera pacifica]|uniref:DUF3800 domain-containing protein n=1 Tax=Rheinheimera pacifica TaxID=173990 RepID=UPI002858591F|nr:DUF3800 domain-containing protein [Rheinheimera pacifica]MDR6982359.1 hypothetical protein [Rheinheimera pacifica]
MDNPGKLIWHIACDESGIDGAPYYGFGTLWMKWQRRGDFSKLVSDLRIKHQYFDEIKWQKAHSKRYQDFYLELIDLFFKREWLAFHCIVIKKADVNKSYHGGDYDLARRKHFNMLLQAKIKNVIKAHKGRECQFRVVVDPIASRYKKADEASHVIVNNQVKQSTENFDAIDNYLTKDSKDSVQIQLSDLLLGAVMSAWQKKATSEGKVAIQKAIAGYLGWKDLEADTAPKERKFNIWYFYEPKLGPRSAETRKVNLFYPLPVR